MSHADNYFLQRSLSMWLGFAHPCLTNQVSRTTISFLLLQTCTALSNIVMSTSLALLLCLSVEMPFSSIMKVFILSGKLISQFNHGLPDIS